MIYWRLPRGLTQFCATGAVFGALLISPILHAQEQFFTQSGGRGLINAKLEARMSKTESDVDVVEEELAKVQDFAKMPILDCSGTGDKLRWNGTAWSCDSEIDPTVMDFAKENLPTCGIGEMLRANGSRFSCGSGNWVNEEVDPTVMNFAKKTLPSCAPGEFLTVDSTLTDFNCTNDEAGLTTESDPFVQGFARTTNPLPSCAAGEVLRANNGVLSCVSDATGITVEVDPVVQAFARNEDYTLTACADDHVIKASTVDGEVQLECVPDAGGEADPLALGDLSDVDTAAQASNTVLMFDGSMWVAASELDPNVQTFARNAYTLAICGTGEVLTTNSDATQLICAADAGGAGDPLNLDDLANVDTSGAVSNSILTFNGTSWVAGDEIDPTVEEFAKNTLPTCGAGEVLTGDGTNLSCQADAGGAGDPLGLTDLSDVTISSAVADQVLRFVGGAWVNSDDKIGALTTGNWCRVVGTEIVCDRGAPSACTPPDVIQWNGTNGWQCTDISASVGGNLDFGDLNDVTFSSLTAGQRITWNGSVWVNEDKNYIGAGDTQFVVVDTGTGTAQIQVDGSPVLTATSGLLTIPAVVNVSNTLTTTNLSVSGTTTLNGFTSNANSTINGDLTVNGEVITSSDLTIGGVTFAQGGISATGQISATSFYGDGSNLTGVTASSADWYNVSNIPTGVEAISDTALTGTELGFLQGTDQSLQTTDSVTFANVTADVTATNATIGVAGVGTLAATTADINGGTIDGTTIGQSVAATASFTTVAANSLEALTGNFTTLTVTGQTTLGNVSVTAIQGDGSLLTNLPAQTPDWYSLTNIPTGVEAISDTALTGTELGFLQGTDQSLQTTDSVTFANVTADVTATNITTTDLTATNLTGTLQTAAQPNVTSVGALTGLDVTGQTTLGNVSVTAIQGDGSLLTNLPTQTPDWYSLMNIPTGVEAISDTALTGTELGFLQGTDQSLQTTDSVTFANVTADVTATNATIGVAGIGTLAATTADINGGTIDGTTIGQSVAATASFTTVAANSLEALTGNFTTLTVTDQTTLGNVSVTAIQGDGSLLTNLPTQTPDWYSLMNIPTGVEAISDTALTGTELGFLQGTDQSLQTTDSVTFANVTADVTATNATIGVAGVGTLAAINSSLTTVDISGQLNAATVSATFFEGDGSLLTNLPSTTPDRIVSDTTSIVVNDGMDSISFTTAGTERMVIDDNGNVGIGTNGPRSDFEIYNITGKTQSIIGSGNSDAQLTFNLPGVSNWHIGTDRSESAFVIMASGDATHDFGVNSAVLAIPVSGNVGIATTNPTTALDVSGTLRIADGGETATDAGAGAIKYDSGALYFSDGSTWEALASDSSAVTELNDLTDAVTDYTTGFNIAIGEGALNRLGTGLNNVALGYQAGYGSSDASATGLDTSRDHFTGIGPQVGYNNTGDNVTASGFSAALENTGDNVTASGFSAALENTGANVTASGFSAARENTGANVTASGVNAARENTGSNVTASGRSSAYQNTGHNLTAIGFFASAYRNASETTAIGADAGRGGDTTRRDAEHNTFIGYRSGYGVMTGSNNVFLGYQSGDNLADGNNNIVIGYDVDIPDPDGNNQLNIGNLIYGNTVANTVSLSGAISATFFEGDGSLLTNLPATDDGDWTVTGDTASRSSGYVSVATAATVTDVTLNVSGTVKIAGTGSETCNASTYGTMRMNPATNRLQFCRP